MIPKILKGSRAVFIHGEPGSGKTSSYLLPIIQSFYEDENELTDNRYVMNQKNEEMMFQNAD